MKRGTGLALALVLLTTAACASGGGGAGVDEPGTQRPRDNSFTNSAGVHLVQAGLSEGPEAQSHFEAAMEDALQAIAEQPENPKGYLVAGQAAVGLHQWVRADTLFDKAQELYPPYQEQLVSEREQGWVEAYNMGAEAMSAGNLEDAQEAFEGADRLYTQRPEARLALGSLYLRQGDTERAVEAYRGALEILTGEPPEGMAEEQMAAWNESRQVAAFNAAQLLADMGDFDEAIAVLQGFLQDNEAILDPATVLRGQTALASFYAQAGRADEAEALYNEILTREDLTSTEYFQVGVGFFNTEDFDRAAEAFGRAAELNPYSRDAILNRVQSLYSRALKLEEQEETPERNEQLREIYSEIIDSAEQVREFDPLNRNVLSFMLRAYRAQADVSPDRQDELTQEAQELVRVYQNQPYEVTNVSLTLQDNTAAQLTGSLTNLTAEPGSTVELRFEALNSGGATVDEQRVTVTAPDQGSSIQFSTTLDLSGGEFAGWRYELVE